MRVWSVLDLRHVLLTKPNISLLHPRRHEQPKKDKGPDEEENLRDLHNAWFAGKMSKVPCEKAVSWRSDSTVDPLSQPCSPSLRFCYFHLQVLSGKHGDYLIRTM